METRLQLSGNWLASRLGANTSVAPTADDQRVLILQAQNYSKYLQAQLIFNWPTPLGWF